MGSDLEPWSLAWLERTTGLKERTIRSYIEQGLLSGALGRGPKAYYSPRHLHRLLAIRKWRDLDGLELEEVRRRLLSATDEQIAEVAAAFDPRAAAAGAQQVLSLLEYVRKVKGSGASRASSAPTSAVSQSPQPPRAVGSPLPEDGLGPPVLSGPKMRKLEPMYSAGSKSSPRPSSGVPSDMEDSVALSAAWGTGGTDATPIGRMLAMVEAWRTAQRPSGGPVSPPSRRSQGEQWLVVRVTPDFEIRVRGVEDPTQVEMLERLADHLRDALLGGDWAP